MFLITFLNAVFEDSSFVSLGSPFHLMAPWNSRLSAILFCIWLLQIMYIIIVSGMGVAQARVDLKL